MYLFELKRLALRDFPQPAVDSCSPPADSQEIGQHTFVPKAVRAGAQSAAVSESAPQRRWGHTEPRRKPVGVQEKAWIGHDPMKKPSQEGEAVAAFRQLMNRWMACLDVMPGLATPCDA